MVKHKVKVKLTKAYPSQNNVLIRLKYEKYINQVNDKMNIYENLRRSFSYFHLIHKQFIQLYKIRSYTI